jgi:hypothetical protein
MTWQLWFWDGSAWGEERRFDTQKEAKETGKLHYPAGMWTIVKTGSQKEYHMVEHRHEFDAPYS